MNQMNTYPNNPNAVVYNHTVDHPPMSLQSELRTETMNTFFN